MSNHRSVLPHGENGSHKKKRYPRNLVVSTRIDRLAFLPSGVCAAGDVGELGHRLQQQGSQQQPLGDVVVLEPRHHLNGGESKRKETFR